MHLGRSDLLMRLESLLMWLVVIDFLAFVIQSVDCSDTDFDKENTIYFRALGKPHGMPLPQFAVMLGLYNEDYIGTEEFAQLPADYLTGLTLS